MEENLIYNYLSHADILKISNYFNNLCGTSDLLNKWLPMFEVAQVTPLLPDADDICDLVYPQWLILMKFYNEDNQVFDADEYYSYIELPDLADDLVCRQIPLVQAKTICLEMRKY